MRRELSPTTRAIAVLAICLLVAVVAGCSKKEPVKIGFAGGITGRVADLGIAGRDGVILAVEQKNRQGGINGRTIELIAKDDRQDPETCLEVDRQLLDQGVTAIIGHMTSSMSVAAVDMINKEKVLVISPTTSTNDLTGLDDWFYRVYPPSAQTAKLLAEHAFNEMGHKTTLVLCDYSNRAHTQSWFQQFKNVYEACGGQATQMTYVSGQDVRFMDIAKQIVEQKPECLFLLANAMDSAMICQQLDKLDFNVQIISSDWSATDEVLQYGAKAVEGMFFYHTVNRFSHKPEYVEFCRRFAERFGREPDFASVHSYDCANIIFTALETNPDSKKLRETIQQIGSFHGLQSDISFDNYGDVIREHFPFRIHQGKFETME